MTGGPSNNALQLTKPAQSDGASLLILVLDGGNSKRAGSDAAEQGE